MLSEPKLAEDLHPKDVINLRNVLVTIMVIMSVRRSIEFTQFTLEEYENIREEEEGYHLIQIYKHETVTQSGPARVFIKDDIKCALDSYVKYYWPWLTHNCNRNNCKIFLVRTKLTKGECCKALDISSINKLMVQVAKRSGVKDITLGSRRTRRSIITGTGKKDGSQKTLDSMAVQAAQSLRTANVHYDYDDRTRECLDTAKLVARELEM